MDICINKQPVTVKECNGQRVVTFREIDEVHGKAAGMTRAAFNRHKSRFTKGKDYFVHDMHEAKERYGIKAPNGITLITESGYFKLAKVFDDDPAWAVQDTLVNVYFQKKAPVAEVPEQMTLQPVPKATKTFQGQPVMTGRDIYQAAGITPNMSHYYTMNDKQFQRGKDYALLVKNDIAEFKVENPCISPCTSRETIFYMSGVEKICNAAGVKFNEEKFKALPARITPPEPSAKFGMITKTLTRECVDVPENPKIQAVIKGLRQKLAALDEILNLFNMYHTPEDQPAYQTVLKTVGSDIASTASDLSRMPFGTITKHI